MEQQYNEMLAGLKQRIKTCDLKAAAEITGGFFKDGRLELRIFGKLFL